MKFLCIPCFIVFISSNHLHAASPTEPPSEVSGISTNEVLGITPEAVTDGNPDLRTAEAVDPRANDTPRATSDSSSIHNKAVDVSSDDGELAEARLLSQQSNLSEAAGDKTTEASNVSDDEVSNIPDEEGLTNSIETGSDKYSQAKRFRENIVAVGTTNDAADGAEDATEVKHSTTMNGTAGFIANGTLQPLDSTDIDTRAGQRQSDTRRKRKRGAKKFFISLNQMPWNKAVTGCEKEGRRLASIRNYNEQKTLEDTLKTAGLQDMKFWIALKSTLVAGGCQEFQWRSGERVNYSKWGRKNPVKDDQKRCVYVQNLHWYNWYCEYTYYFVCEYY